MTDVVVNSIADDVWGSEDEQTGSLRDEVEGLGLTTLVNYLNVFLYPWWILEQII